jgi:tetratricopeptide (TPR) repeat protein
MHRDDEALREMERLIPRAEAAQDLHNLARALGNTASFYAQRGELDKDHEYRKRMLDVAERQRDQGQILLACMSLSTNAFLRGDWPDAWLHIERAESIVRALGTTRLALWPAGARSWLSLYQGDLAGAAESARNALGLMDRTSDLIWRRNVERVLVEIDLLEGRTDAAMERLQALMEQPGWKKEVGFLNTLALALLARGELSDAWHIADHAMTRAADQKRLPDFVDVLLIRGRVAAAQGRGDEATASFEDALHRARGIPFPYGIARALLGLGCLHLEAGRGGEAREELGEAREIFQRLGAHGYAARTEDALRDGAGEQTLA